MTVVAPPSQLRAAVVVASADRPSWLADTVATLREQTVPYVGVASVPDEASLPPDAVDWSVVTGPRGSAVQRNTGLDSLDDVDVVFFFDDDAVVRHDYLANALAFLDAHPDVLALTGRVVLDGVGTGEIDRATAAAALTASESEPLTGAWRRTRQLYGCNFAYRIAAAPDLRFDDRLPLYSWLEDHDFARQLGRYGVLAEVDDCVVVHRAAASGGRQQHARLGYSQVANPVYLWRKGSFPAWLAARELLRPLAKNVVHARPGRDSGWRRERLRGNLLAIGDVAQGRITLERARGL